MSDDPIAFQLRPYDPRDWYWLADDGRLFSSLRGALVEPTDAAYLAWAQQGGPTTWPRDQAGVQTIAALQAVLALHGLFAPRPYDPRDWYWLADDGRLFSSARGALVQPTDAAYLAWAEQGGPTTWPRDEAGEQTAAALQAVLAPYGLFAGLLAYARDARWRAEVGGMVWNGVPIATDDSSKIKIAGARLAAQANPAFETTWYGADGEGVVVDTALIIDLSDAVLAHVDGTFTIFGQVKAAIAAGTITSREEIDAAFS